MCHKKWLAYVSCAIWLGLELGSDMRSKNFFIPQLELPALWKRILASLIYAWASSVNVLQLNTHPLSCAINSFVSWSTESERNNWNVPAVPTLQLSWPAFTLPTPPLTSLSDLQKHRLGSSLYQPGDARSRLHSVRKSRAVQISPMILLLAERFNAAQPFCSSRAKSFLLKSPCLFLMTEYLMAMECWLASLWFSACCQYLL